MRSGLLKKFISVIITAVMLTVPFMYCFSSASEVEKYPIIYVDSIIPDMGESDSSETGLAGFFCKNKSIYCRIL